MLNNKENLKKELERRKRQNKKAAIRFLTIVVAIALLCAAYFVMATLISDGFFYTVIIEEPEFFFYDADYDYNIFEDSEYRDILDSSSGKIYYSADGGFFTQSVSEEDFDDHGEAAKVMFELVIAIQNGDSDKYNSYMSPDFPAGDKKGKFTMQQIYDVNIVHLGTEEVEGNNGIYQRAKMSFEYKIRENNGTFTKNVDSDASVEQNVWLSTNNPEGKFMIDEIDVNYNLEITPHKEMNVVGITVATLILIVLVGGVVVVTVFVMRKTRSDDKIASKANKDSE